MQTLSNDAADRTARCAWARTPLSIAYHDAEWGVPVHDDRVLFEFLTLVQCGKMPALPVVLYGKAYWEPLVAWLEHTVKAEGKIHPQDLNLFHVADDPNTAANIIIRHRSER